MVWHNFIDNSPVIKVTTCCAVWSCGYETYYSLLIGDRRQSLSHQHTLTLTHSHSQAVTLTSTHTQSQSAWGEMWVKQGTILWPKAPLQLEVRLIV